MQSVLLGYCVGALLLAMPWSGDPAWLGTGAGAALLGAAVTALGALSGPRHVRRCCLLLLGVLLGFGWSAHHHDRAFAARLPAGPATDAAGLEVRIRDEPVALAVADDQPAAVRFQASELAAPGRTLRLSWYDAPPMAQGEIWRLDASVRGPWSYANPAGFDYERWLIGRAIHGTGYVRAGERLAAAPQRWLTRARHRLIEFLSTAPEARRGIYGALLLGRTAEMPEALWEVLRRTGTIHLMVISGLHVGLAAVLGDRIGRLLMRLTPWFAPGLALWLDARKLGALCAALLAGLYVGLSGAGLASLRALLMAAPFLLLTAWGRTARAGTALLLALTVLLVLDPLSVHQQGFWLSFGAVAILILGFSGRRGARRNGLDLVRAQLLLGLALTPLVLLLTDRFAWVSMPANLVAVPVVSLLVVPLTLLAGMLGVLWPAGGRGLLGLADLVLAPLVDGLTWLASAPEVHLGTHRGGLLVAQAGALWCLLRPPVRHLAVCLLCLALPFLPSRTGVPSGHYRVTALDVGQGSAVSIDTTGHRLLFDAGPGYPSGFETGSSVVVPNLRALGPDRLDVLILSHADLDHTGGAAAVRDSLPVARVLSSFSLPGATPCHGRRWRWDGVAFALLDVSRPTGSSDNDRSCILLIDNGQHATLLAGDIGHAVEGSLLRALPTTVHLQFAPHHGSRTSSSTALVRVATPVLVFVSAGWHNRFGHPHPEVRARYRRAGATLYQTGRDGALTWTSAAPHEVHAWRRQQAPYWRAQVGSGDGSSKR